MLLLDLGSHPAEIVLLPRGVWGWFGGDRMGRVAGGIESWMQEEMSIVGPMTQKSAPLRAAKVLTRK